MANEYPRSYRVADHLQRELSQIIRLEMKDPRVSAMVTIASVDVSRDLSVAKIYYTLMDDSERADTQEGLNRSAGYLRKRLASSLSMRSVPQLRFYYDDSVAHGNRMSALIDEAVKSNSTEDVPASNDSSGNESPDSSPKPDPF